MTRGQFEKDAVLLKGSFVEFLSSAFDELLSLVKETVYFRFVEVLGGGNVPNAFCCTDYEAEQYSYAACSPCLGSQRPTLLLQMFSSSCS